jgi:hypothetical protein
LDEIKTAAVHQQQSREFSAEEIHRLARKSDACVWSFALNSPERVSFEQASYIAGHKNIALQTYESRTTLLLLKAMLHREIKYFLCKSFTDRSHKDCNVASNDMRGRSGLVKLKILR